MADHERGCLVNVECGYCTCGAEERVGWRQRAERAELQLHGMTGERDTEREISRQWEERAERAEAACAAMRAALELWITLYREGYTQKTCDRVGLGLEHVRAGAPGAQQAVVAKAEAALTSDAGRGWVRLDDVLAVINDLCRGFRAYAVSVDGDSRLRADALVEEAKDKLRALVKP